VIDRIPLEFTEMRIAVLSDIHGNRVALDAALADLDAAGIDEYWILGDLVALGPDPVGVLERLARLSPCWIVRGNSDRYLVTGDRPPSVSPHPGQEAGKLKEIVDIACGLAWTQGAITIAGWFDWLAQLPLELQKTLPDGTECLLVHEAPGSDDGTGLTAVMPDDEMRDRLKGSCANLICVGHTHQPLDRRVDKWHVLNPGSIGRPRPDLLGASYAILDATQTGYTVEHREVDYDREQVIAQMRKLRHPTAEFISQCLRGLV
jgi:predicted phosphodiesterase